MGGTLPTIGRDLSWRGSRPTVPDKSYKTPSTWRCPADECDSLTDRSGRESHSSVSAATARCTGEGCGAGDTRGGMADAGAGSTGGPWAGGEAGAALMRGIGG